MMNDQTNHAEDVDEVLEDFTVDLHSGMDPVIDRVLSLAVRKHQRMFPVVYLWLGGIRQHIAACYKISPPRFVEMADMLAEFD